MPRYYEMTVEVRRLPVVKTEAVVQACCEEWGFDENDAQWSDSSTAAYLPQEKIERWRKLRRPKCVDLRLTGRDDLCGGETEQEFADRLVQSIWQANGGFVAVAVCATYLENLPCEEYTYGAKEFASMKKEKKHD